MRILLISQYFKPEVGAGVERVYYFAKYLARRGYFVKVIAGVPNYPTGKIYPGYKIGFLYREVIEKNLEVIRTFVYPAKYTSALKRIINYFSFTVSSSFVGTFQKDINIIIASSPPLTTGLVGLFISLFRNKPLIFEARDVWPGAAVELSVLRSRLVAKILRYLEIAIYKRSELVIAPTQETKNILLKDNRFLNEGKVKTILNSVDLKSFDSKKIDGSMRKKYNMEGKFVVLYLGTLGLQQGVGTLIECIKKLKSRNSISFLVVGEGVAKEFLKKSKEKYKLDNMKLLDSVGYDKVPSYVNACDVGLALLKKNKYQDAALAVKVFDYFAGGKPVVVSGGEAMKKLIDEGQAGFWVKPENPTALAEKIIEVSKTAKESVEKMGVMGRKLTEEKFNREIQAKELEKVLKLMRKDLVSET
jgi:glycosyltransferase involved in cell wall biosynthesis